MKKLIDFLRANLEIGINEAKGVVLLGIVIIACFAATMFYSNFSSKETSNILIQEYKNTEIPDEENEESNADNYKNHYSKRHFDKSNFENHASVKFPFNPNMASENEFYQLGMPKFLSKIIVNYRNKGGKFRYKEDLLKIYGMKQELYQELDNYILLPNKGDKYKSSYDETVAYSSSNSEEKPTKVKFVEKHIERFDINKADTTDLIALKGIGTIFALRILKYRDVLGGFADINQVSETYGLNPEVMDEIKKYGFVGTAVKKIRINENNFAKHPYLKYQQMKTIQNYKIQHGNYKSIEDLKNVQSIDEITLKKLEPYIDFK